MQLFIDIWHSFHRLPTWVQIWMVVVLMPVNLASLVFLDQPAGGWIAILAVLGIVLNTPFVLLDRGFGKGMALPHVLMWTPAVGLALWVLIRSPDASAAYTTFLVVFVTVDIVSLGFDYKDAFDWVRRDRSVA